MKTSEEVINRMQSEMRSEMVSRIIKGELNGERIAGQWINVNNAVRIAEKFILEALALDRIEEIRETVHKEIEINHDYMTEIRYCDDCIHLAPKEKDQTEKKEPHMCNKMNVPLYHFNQHPHIVRPDNCNHYQKED